MSMFCNMDETIDSRDIIERIEELTLINPDDISREDAEELTILKELAAEGESYSSDWQHGETLIRDTYFVDYVRQMLEDCGEIPRGLPWYISINWEETAENIQQQNDYTELDFDGATYYIRTC